VAVVKSAAFSHRDVPYQVDEVEGELSVLGANGLTKVTEWAQLDLTANSPSGRYYHAYLPGIGEVFGTDLMVVTLDMGRLIDNKFGVKYVCFGPTH
jgi:hypothetical protein